MESIYAQLDMANATQSKVFDAILQTAIRSCPIRASQNAKSVFSTEDQFCSKLTKFFIPDQ